MANSFADAIFDIVNEHESEVEIEIGNLEFVISNTVSKLEDLKSLIAPSERIYNNYDQALISRTTMKHWVARIDELINECNND